MATLEGKTPASTYGRLLTFDSETIGSGSSAQYINNGKNAATALSISTTSVGIGIESPSGTLQVQGQAGGAGQIYVTDADSTGTGNSLLISVSGSDAFIRNRKEDANLKFGVDNGGTDLNEVLSILGDGAVDNTLVLNGGNVGIGTTTPAQLLQLTSSTSDAAIRFEDSGTLTYEIGLDDGTSNFVIGQAIGTPHITIVGGTGNVGIGTTPNQKFTVEGTISLKEQTDDGADTAGYSQIWVDDAGAGTLMFTNDSGAKFTVDVTAV